MHVIVNVLVNNDTQDLLHKEFHLLAMRCEFAA